MHALERVGSKRHRSARGDESPAPHGKRRPTSSTSARARAHERADDESRVAGAASSAPAAVECAAGGGGAASAAAGAALGELARVKDAIVALAAKRTGADAAVGGTARAPAPVGSRITVPTICPSEVARALYPSEAAWRAAMPLVRAAAAELAGAGWVAVTQRGCVVDVLAARGPVRIAWVAR
jgi:hypothetical protein